MCPWVCAICTGSIRFEFHGRRSRRLGEGNGSNTAATKSGNTGTAAGAYQDNQAAPVTLYEYSLRWHDQRHPGRVADAAADLDTRWQLRGIGRVRFFLGGHAATHDFLTNLLNRSEILAAIDKERSRGGREGKPTTIIMADIDHFKRINDSLGHAAGDDVLKEVGRRLQSDLRPYDVVGRYGGEEFLIILPGCDLATGTRRADELRNLVAKDPIFTPFGTTTATVSLGVTAAFNRECSVSDLLHEADVCMYAAKKKGRNRVESLSTKTRQKSAGHG